MDERFHYLLENGRKHFVDGAYEKAEKFLDKARKVNADEPELYQMLATIYYDRGKFKKAINTFQQALRLDPDYTDASVGLSIVLNDIGRYEEGRKVFSEAQQRLEKRKSDEIGSATGLYTLLSEKHFELGQIYMNHRMFQEASEQFETSRRFQESDECVLLQARALSLSGHAERSMHILKMAVRARPDFTAARIAMGQQLFDAGRVAEAVGQWENVLLRDPSNQQARDLIRRSNAVNLTEERI